ncbi:heterokaryon incompatibility protein-domain-containing protein [Xylariomycetidae sp. FL0641]|nr:heterokaryon incompatibility protein-domain-containing protein [Xylariomycetidae sp. FL0641]
MACESQVLRTLTPYTYAPLSEGSQTRILEILPSLDATAPLQCLLKDMNIDSEYDSDYEALSYTWGEPELTESVVINSNYLKTITANLHDALCELRSPRESRRIWVDAICINQDDDSDKERQIPSMGKIYSYASAVRVWLGKSEAGAAALRKLQCLTKKSAVVPYSEIWGTQSSEIGDTQSPTNHLPDAFEMLRDSLQDLLELPWFRRRWVIQEVVLNSTVILHCADIWLPWARLARCLEPGKIPQTHKAIATMADIWKGRHFGKSNVNSDLFSLLSAFSKCGCEKGHDFIYALCGIASDVELLPGPLPSTALETACIKSTYRVRFNKRIRPLVVVYLDYSVPLKDFYTHITIQLIQKREMLLPSILYECGIRHPLDRKPKWPSWVPDWRQQPVRRQPVPRQPVPQPMSCTAQLSYSINFTSDGEPIAEVLSEGMAGVRLLGYPFPQYPDEAAVTHWFRSLFTALQRWSTATKGGTLSAQENEALILLCLCACTTTTPQDAVLRSQTEPLPYWSARPLNFKEAFVGEIRQSLTGCRLLSSRLCSAMSAKMEAMTVFRWEEKTIHEGPHRDQWSTPGLTRGLPLHLPRLGRGTMHIREDDEIFLITKPDLPGVPLCVISENGRSIRAQETTGVNYC